MPRINARKCPRTGKLFETDAKYRDHIVGLRKHLNERRPGKIRRHKAHIQRIAYQDDLRTELNALANMNDLEEYFRNNFGKIMIAHNGGGRPEIHALLNTLKMEKFDLRLTFSECTSNTHAAPRNGETNWGGRKDNVPRGYPGFSGHISFQLNFNPAERNSLCLEPSRGLAWAGVHTGTGGGIGSKDVHKWEFGVTLFLSDFEGLKKQYFIDKLAGRLDLW